MELKWPCRTGPAPSCTQTHGVQLTCLSRNPFGLLYEPEPKPGSTHSLRPFLRLTAGDGGRLMNKTRHFILRDFHVAPRRLLRRRQTNRSPG